MNLKLLEESLLDIENEGDAKKLKALLNIGRKPRNPILKHSD